MGRMSAFAPSPPASQVPIRSASRITPIRSWIGPTSPLGGQVTVATWSTSIPPGPRQRSLIAAKNSTPPSRREIAWACFDRPVPVHSYQPSAGTTARPVPS